MSLKPFFSFSPFDPRAADFSAFLTAELGEFSLEDSNAIINIGGDGTYLYAFQNYPDKPNFAVKPPKGTNVLYHGHHGIENGSQLVRAFEEAAVLDMVPLKATMHLSDGAQKSIYAYGDVRLDCLTAEAILFEPSLGDGKTHRVMSGGLIVATALGSTARNKSCGGVIMGVRDSGIVMTSNGIPVVDQEEFFSHNEVSRKETAQCKLNVSFASAAKRPVVLYADSQSYMTDGSHFHGLPHTITADRHIESVSIRKAPERTRHFLRNEEFATHSID